MVPGATLASLLAAQNPKGSGEEGVEEGAGAVAEHVGADGAMQRHWIQGGKNGVTLHAPKGMAIVKTPDGDVRLFLWEKYVGSPQGKPAVLFVQVGAAGYEAGRGSASCASRRPAADAVQVVRHLRQEEQRGAVRITQAAAWLTGLAA